MKHNLGNEFYTLRSTIERCPFLEKIKNRNILCPYDSENSEFVKASKEKKEEWKIQGIEWTNKDYRSEETEQKRKEDAVIFSNPPFYIWSNTVKYFYDKGNDQLLIGRTSFKEILWKEGIPFKSSRSNSEWFKVPDINIFKEKKLVKEDRVKVSNICWYWIEGRKNEE